MRKLTFLICLPLLVQVASATVIYSFTGSDTEGSPFPAGPFTFTLTLSNFINSDLTNLPPGGSLTCDACSFVSLLPSHPGTSSDTREVDYAFSGIGSLNFYFGPGSFEAPGVYNTVLLNGLNDATLTVTQTDAVPEPSSAALSSLGIGVMFLLWYALRRRVPL